jgi:Secretion system C-terminal sorting domain
LLLRNKFSPLRHDEYAHRVFFNLSIMMLDKYLLLILLLVSTSINAQKEDNVWMLGYRDSIVESGDKFTFNNNQLTRSPKLDSLWMDWTNSSICDSQGNLQFYTNGVYIYNRDSKPMLNGVLDIQGCFLGGVDAFCSFNQQIITLPYPNHPKQYLMIYGNALHLNLNGISQAGIQPLLYSLVDMRQDSERGGVIQKNILVCNDTFATGSISACRHANGRDWWIILNKLNSNRYSRFLVSPSGISFIGEQAVGSRAYNLLNSSVFSPDGTRFARIASVPNLNYSNYIDLYNFDRCSGLLSNHTQFNQVDTCFTSGIAFSPNSRYLYLSMGKQLYQLDMQATNILTSKIKIAVPDGFRDFTYLVFWAIQLAPDGKIYMAAGPSRYLHTIENPDNAGLACNFRQHSIHLYSSDRGMPNLPHFRLGALRGSSCDTLTPSSEVNNLMQHIKVFPNPVVNQLSIDLTMNDYNHQGKVAIVLYDVLGHNLLRQTVSDYSSVVRMDLSGLVAGVYLVGLEIEGRRVAVERIVKQRN